MSDVRRLGDRYEVGGLLGRGGMASVHEGRDLRLGRRVAIKILRPELADDPAFLARFRREAQSAASLNHPNIVAVYDTGEDAIGEGHRATTVPYIVMELVEGITLKELLHSGNKLVPERSLEITSDVLAALDYSHRHGIIHRDIKPGNVMLTTAGVVKVMDFGIARAVAASGQTATSTSTVLGTAAYLSPEQAQGRTVDARSDLYSAGCVLFELTTRRAPFSADSPVAIAFAHVNEPPPVPSEVDPTLPRQLDPIVARAMAKDPADRYQTAVEFRADVERAIAGVPVTTMLLAAGGADAQATEVMGAMDPDATIVAVGAAAATGAMTPVIAGGAGAGAAESDTVLPEEAKGGGVWRRIGLVALSLAVLAAAFWGGRALLASTATRTVEVPGLEGMTVAEAERALEAAGLRLGGPEFTSSDLPKDTVIGQDPRPGELYAEGGVVVVVVSAGKEQVQVPDLIDFRSVADVRRTLSESGLTLGKVTSRNSDEPEETVLRQRPEPYETVDEGSTVDIWVSNAQVKVPGVVGQSNAAARTRLFDDGFEVTYGPERETSQFAPGTVVAQTPEGGATAKKGSLVTLTLAKAPPPPTPTPTPSPSPTPTVSTPPTPAASEAAPDPDADEVGSGPNPLEGTEDGDDDPGPVAGPPG